MSLRKLSISGVLFVTVLLAGCGKPVEVETTETKATETKIMETEATATRDFSLAKRCANGDELYRLTNGDLVQWNAPSTGDPYWVRFEGDLNDYCPGES